MAEIAFRMLISLTLKDPVNMESVVFRDPKNMTRAGVYHDIVPWIGAKLHIKAEFQQFSRNVFQGVWKTVRNSFQSPHSPLNVDGSTL